MTIGWVSREPVTISNSPRGNWVQVLGGDVPLRSWWADVDHQKHVDVSKNIRERVVLVLPEVFGVNLWVRSVAERIAEAGVQALAMPLFARTAPALDLGYEPADLLEGRRHKDATTADQIQADVALAITWLQQRCPKASVTVVGFCFGGHAALLAATHPQVVSTFDFYGAGVSRMRPGGGPPSLELLPQVKGRLTCLCGTRDPLIPAEERAAIRAGLRSADPNGHRFRFEEIEGADHGFMCEMRSSFNSKASSLGWQLLLEDFSSLA